VQLLLALDKQTETTLNEAAQTITVCEGRSTGGLCDQRANSCQVVHHVQTPPGGLCDPVCKQRVHCGLASCTLIVERCADGAQAAYGC
jgi:hypothetical protein